MRVLQHLSLLFLTVSFMVMTTARARAATADYARLAYIDQTLLIGLGLSYTKMEVYTEVGNYFLLSQTNPRVDVRYVSKIEEKFRSSLHGYYVRELYTPENPSFLVRNRQSLNRFGLTYQPHWFSEGKGVSYGFNLQLKQANLFKQVPTPALLTGAVGQRLSYEAGVAIKWYGQTVSRLPMSLDLDFSYVNHLVTDASDLDYGAGISYRIALDFDFGRRSYFSNFNIRAFYEYEKIESEPYPMSSKELGFSVARAFSF